MRAGRSELFLSDQNIGEDRVGMAMAPRRRGGGAAERTLSVGRERTTFAHTVDVDQQLPREGRTPGSGMNE